MAQLNENTKIQVLISEDTNQGKFQDALYFTKEEYEVLTEEALTALKTERVNNWITSVTEASTRETVLPTVEELTNHKEELQAQIVEVEEKIKVVLEGANNI